MLVHLSIKDLAIIEGLEVEFGPGLNILTGETGAGKSIILGAVQLLMGARAQTDLVRQGADEASVQGIDRTARIRAAQHLPGRVGLEPSPELILRRVVSSSGRSRAYVNNVMVNLTVLADLGSRILSISGQHEAQRLLKPEEHLILLDAFGGLEGERRSLEEAHARYRALVRELEELEAAESGKNERNRSPEFSAGGTGKGGLFSRERKRNCARNRTGCATPSG